MRSYIFEPVHASPMTCWNSMLGGQISVGVWSWVVTGQGAWISSMVPESRAVVGLGQVRSPVTRWIFWALRDLRPWSSTVQFHHVLLCYICLYHLFSKKKYIYIYTKTIDPSNIQENKRPNPDVFSDQDYPPSFVVSWSHLRVSIASILKCARRFLAFFAIKCASWTSINQGTSHRSACSSVGFDEYASVSSSNAMLERTPIYNLLSNQFSQILRSINI